MAALPESERPEKVLFVIITDGEENQSREFTYPKIEGMIKHQTDVYKWDFMYIGANQDAIAVGSKMGISAQSSVSYAANHMGTSASYDMIGTKVASYRSAMTKADALSAVAFNDQERAVAMGVANNTSASI